MNLEHEPLQSKDEPLKSGVETLAHSSLQHHLADRRIGKTKWRQGLRFRARGWPAYLQKQLRKSLWRSPFRHMHYFPLQVRVEMKSDGSWSFKLRGRGQIEVCSSPLADLRNQPPGKPVIAATGPSAKEFDWSRLMDGSRPIWAMNGAPSFLADRGLKCDYLVVSDHRFAREGIEHIQIAAAGGAVLLLSPEAAAGILQTGGDILQRSKFHVFEKVNDWYGLPAVNAADLAAMNRIQGEPFLLPEHPCKGVGWSHDASFGVFAGRTVTFAALQLAVWQGAKQIDVVGLDLGGGSRCYDERIPAVSQLEADKRDYILPAFDCLARALAGGPVSIFNHSEVSPLPRDLVPQQSVQG